MAPPDDIVGESPALQEVFHLMERVANTPATVLITGESGTGKEMVARRIHFKGARASHPFVAVNCTAIPANLMEAELFGYEKGAFTDAKIPKRGLLETAEGGTLFLDEIGLMPTELQAKLLSVLGMQTFRRLGGTEEIVSDVRFIAATNEDLERAVSEGQFRPDLYYRLNVVRIPLPPLRHRGEDILEIAAHFLKLYSKRYQKQEYRISKGAKRWMLSYPWPGNIRELRNVIERVVLLSRSDRVGVDDLAVGKEGDYSEQEAKASLDVSAFGEIRITFPPWGIALADVERKLIVEAIKEAKGNVTRAAQLLHMSRDVLRYRLKKHRLNETKKI